MGCHKIEIALQAFAIRKSGTLIYIRNFMPYAEIPLVLIHEQPDYFKKKYFANCLIMK